MQLTTCMLVKKKLKQPPPPQSPHTTYYIKAKKHAKAKVKKQSRAWDTTYNKKKKQGINKEEQGD